MNSQNAKRVLALALSLNYFMPICTPSLAASEKPSAQDKLGSSDPRNWTRFNPDLFRPADKLVPAAGTLPRKVNTYIDGPPSFPHDPTKNSVVYGRGKKNLPTDIYAKALDIVQIGGKYFQAPTAGNSKSVIINGQQIYLHGTTCYTPLPDNSFVGNPVQIQPFDPTRVFYKRNNDMWPSIIYGEPGSEIVIANQKFKFPDAGKSKWVTIGPKGSKQSSQPKDDGKPKEDDRGGDKGSPSGQNSNASEQSAAEKAATDKAAADKAAADKASADKASTDKAAADKAAADKAAADKAAADKAAADKAAADKAAADKAAADKAAADKAAADKAAADKAAADKAAADKAAADKAAADKAAADKAAADKAAADKAAADKAAADKAAADKAAADKAAADKAAADKAAADKAAADKAAADKAAADKAAADKAAADKAAADKAAADKAAADKAAADKAAADKAAADKAAADKAAADKAAADKAAADKAAAELAAEKAAAEAAAKAAAEKVAAEYAAKIAADIAANQAATEAAAKAAAEQEAAIQAAAKAASEQADQAAAKAAAELAAAEAAAKVSSGSTGTQEQTSATKHAELNGQPIGIRVEAKCDLYAAHDPGLAATHGGIAPIKVEFYPMSGLYLTASDVVGKTVRGPNEYGNQHPADGSYEGQAIEEFPSFKNLSGVKNDAGPSLQVYGVFGSGNGAGTLPKNLDFSKSGLTRSFKELHPQLNQIFFIGDGLTGDGSGEQQKFFVPEGADSLYIGVVDDTLEGQPGDYEDNSGAIDMTCRLLGGVADQPTETSLAREQLNTNWQPGVSQTLSTPSTSESHESEQTQTTTEHSDSTEHTSNQVVQTHEEPQLTAEEKAALEAEAAEKARIQKEYEELMAQWQKEEEDRLARQKAEQEQWERDVAAGVNLVDTGKMVDATQAKQYLLELINKDRAAYGVGPVKLDEIAGKAGQGHADEMSAKKYLSHWNYEGKKPDQRYTEAGGRDACQENCSGVISSSVTAKPQLFTKAFIEHQEQQMMAEVAPNDGHKLCILDPAHTHVGLGLTANAVPVWFQSTYPHMTQEFVNHYGQYSEIPQTIKNGQVITFSGALEPGCLLHGIQIMKDPLPTPGIPAMKSYTMGEQFIGAMHPNFQFNNLGMLTVEGNTFRGSLKADPSWGPGTYYLMIFGTAPGKSKPFLFSNRTMILQ